MCLRRPRGEFYIKGRKMTTQDQNGYIKLSRNVRYNGWLSNPSLWAFWCWCLLKASYKPIDVVVGHQSVHLEAGQFIFGRHKAAKELNQSEQSIRTHLKYCLEKDKNLTIKTTNKFSIITVVNWDSYQNIENESNQQSNQPLTNNQPATNHKQEVQEVKEVKKKRLSPIDFIESVKVNPAYSHVDFDIELAKMDAWLLLPSNKGRKKTARFILNWINKIDRPVSVTPIKPNYSEFANMRGSHD